MATKPLSSSQLITSARSIPNRENSQVDEFVNAHIVSLISALGGIDHANQDAPYVLGDDALGCLRDLKRWIKAFDEKLNRLDVARVIAHSSLVREDLPQILADWDSKGRLTGKPFKISLAAIELLVPLLWPVDLFGERYTKATNRHKPHIQRAQRAYREAILGHPSNRVLVGAACIALPSIAVDKQTRTARDVAIVRLILYFLRNLLVSDEDELSDHVNHLRNTAILAFEHQNIFDLLATLSANADDFQSIDIALLEVVFSLIRGIDPLSLYSSSLGTSKSMRRGPEPWHSREDGSQSHLRLGNSRHNRFGTLTSVVIQKDERVTVSGQRGINSSTDALDKINSTKKWHRRKVQGSTKDNSSKGIEKPVVLSFEATNILRKFTEIFLDTSFNPLIISVRKQIERESSQVNESNKDQFVYVVSWFLTAELERQRESPDEEFGYGLVAGVLDHQSLIVLTKLIRGSVEELLMTRLAYGLSAFKNTLLVALEMSRSAVQADQDIAETMISRLFYEQTTLDLFVSLPTVLKEKSLELQKSCCDLIYLLLKVLEVFSRNSHLFVKRKRNHRRKSGTKRSAEEMESGDQVEELSGDQDEDLGDDDPLSTSAAKEIAFEFSVFESKFFTQTCVDMFCNVLTSYRELSDTQLKRIVAFFHRVFFRNGEHSLLFRIDLINVFVKCLDPVSGIQFHKTARYDMQQFVKHYTRRLVQTLDERPVYFVELLFTKMSDTVFVLEHGYTEPPKTKKSRGGMVAADAAEKDIERLGSPNLHGTDADDHQIQDKENLYESIMDLHVAGISKSMISSDSDLPNHTGSVLLSSSASVSPDPEFSRNMDQSDTETVSSPQSETAESTKNPFTIEDN
ncbi:timeless protein-domain-containing protein [Lipomyces oligophaga]|uniref:timeless protein-domain-containing protein n=1 Tax=Lipomyces oligophaga TaxID=45792 RepID=UPI0034CE8D28